MAKKIKISQPQLKKSLFSRSKCFWKRNNGWIIKSNILNNVSNFAFWQYFLFVEWWFLPKMTMRNFETSSNLCHRFPWEYKPRWFCMRKIRNTIPVHYLTTTSIFCYVKILRKWPDWLVDILKLSIWQTVSIKNYKIPFPNRSIEFLVECYIGRQWNRVSSNDEKIK